ARSVDLDMEGGVLSDELSHCGCDETGWLQAADPGSSDLGEAAAPCAHPLSPRFETGGDPPDKHDGQHGSQDRGGVSAQDVSVPDDQVRDRRMSARGG